MSNALKAKGAAKKSKGRKRKYSITIHATLDDLDTLELQNLLDKIAENGRDEPKIYKTTMFRAVSEAIFRGIETVDFA